MEMRGTGHGPPVWRAPPAPPVGLGVGVGVRRLVLESMGSNHPQVASIVIGNQWQSLLLAQISLPWVRDLASLVAIYDCDCDCVLLPDWWLDVEMIDARDFEERYGTQSGWRITVLFA